MSNRVYNIVLGVLIMALVAAAGASFALHGFSLSPLALCVAFLLIFIPAGLFLRFALTTWLFPMSPRMRAELAERRRQEPKSSLPVWIAAISFVASHIWLAALLIFIPKGIDSNFFQIMLLPWLGLFLLGNLGLVYTSLWIQHHPIAVAFAGIPVLAVGTALILWAATDSAAIPALFFIALDLGLTCMLMFSAPAFVWFARQTGQID